ncbi:unnamed protein product [Pleuronectes platessa]|uniref:Uncharacterized protein n=1 Tax=Pleuronectes platessa TaxID=8262 RepID=A0A9N7UDF0_PLEPL|nr:unnamed protein product [Pleuronectes platessa]
MALYSGSEARHRGVGVSRYGQVQMALSRLSSNRISQNTPVTAGTCAPSQSGAATETNYHRQSNRCRRHGPPPLAGTLQGRAAPHVDVFPPARSSTAVGGGGGARQWQIHHDAAYVTRLREGGGASGVEERRLDERRLLTDLRSVTCFNWQQQVVGSDSFKQEHVGTSARPHRSRPSSPEDLESPRVSTCPAPLLHPEMFEFFRNTSVVRFRYKVQMEQQQLWISSHQQKEERAGSSRAARVLLVLSPLAGGSGSVRSHHVAVERLV